MNTYHIYYNGRHLDSRTARSKNQAVIEFLDEKPEYDMVHLQVMEVYIP